MFGGMEPIQKAFHAIIFPVFVFTVYYYHEVMVIPPDAFGHSLTHDVIGGHWKYLTFLTAVRNTLTPLYPFFLFQWCNFFFIFLHNIFYRITRERIIVRTEGHGCRAKRFPCRHFPRVLVWAVFWPSQGGHPAHLHQSPHDLPRHWWTLEVLDIHYLGKAPPHLAGSWICFTSEFIICIIYYKNFLIFFQALFLNMHNSPFFK